MERQWDFGISIFDCGTDKFEVYVDNELFTFPLSQMALNKRIDELLESGVTHSRIKVVHINTKKYSILDVRNVKI